MGEGTVILYTVNEASQHLDSGLQLVLWVF